MPQTPVIPAENAKNSPDAPVHNKEPAFSALPYYKAALAMIFQNPRLIVWKIAGDFLAQLTTFLICAILLASIGVAVLTPPEIFQSAAFLTGTTGIAFVLWLFNLFFNSFTHSGIYATINYVLKNPQNDKEQSPTTPSFFSSAAERLDATLGLQIISFVARTTLVFLALTLIITLFSTFPLTIADQRITTAAIWAFGFALYMIFTLLVRLTIEVVAAPLFIDQRNLPDAILHAADFVLEYPTQIYRLFVSMLSITLIPLGVYFLLLMTQNAILLFAPPLSIIGIIIRVFADLLLFISLAAIAVIFYSAVFAFYGERRAIWTTSDLEDFMHNPENSTPKFLSSLFTPAKKAPSTPKTDFSEGATLESLTPSENPNIVTFDQVFDPEVLTHFAPQTRDNTGPETPEPNDSNDLDSTDTDDDSQPSDDD